MDQDVGQADERPFGGAQAQHNPEGGGLEVLLGQEDLAPADVLVRVELDLLEDRRPWYVTATSPCWAVARLGAVRLAEDLQHLEVTARLASV